MGGELAKIATQLKQEDPEGEHMAEAEEDKLTQLEQAEKLMSASKPAAKKKKNDNGETTDTIEHLLNDEDQIGAAIVTPESKQEKVKRQIKNNNEGILENGLNMGNTFANTECVDCEETIVIGNGNGTGNGNGNGTGTDNSTGTGNYTGTGAGTDAGNYTGTVGRLEVDVLAINNSSSSSNSTEIKTENEKEEEEADVLNEENLNEENETVESDEKLEEQSKSTTLSDIIQALHLMKHAHQAHQ